jgi:hypothetical protein
MRAKHNWLLYLESVKVQFLELFTINHGVIFNQKKRFSHSAACCLRQSKNQQMMRQNLDGLRIHALQTLALRHEFICRGIWRILFPQEVGKPLLKLRFAGATQTSRIVYERVQVIWQRKTGLRSEKHDNQGIKFLPLKARHAGMVVCE